MLMTWFNVSLYSVAIVVHVLAATTLLASTLVSPLIRRSLVQADSLDTLRLWLGFGRRASRLNPAMALLVLASGLYLGTFGWWTEGWFALAIGGWVANSMLAALVVKRAAGALSSAVGQTSKGTIPEDIDALRRSARWAVAESVMRGNDLAMVYVMFTKPPIAGACIALALFIATSFAAERLGGRRERRQNASPAAPVADPSFAR